MKKFKIGIIGFGNIGKKRFNVIKKLKKSEIEISYICDNKKNIKKLKKIKLIKNWEDAKNFDVDLVIISTPTNISEKIAKRFSGKFNMLIEKPITTNLKLIKRITSNSFKNKKILKTGYNLRFDEGLLKVKKILNQRKIGKIYYLKITYANGAAKTNTNRVGSLVDMGAHSINLIQWFFHNSKINIKNNIGQKNEFYNKKKIDNGFITLEINKIICFLHHGFCSWKNQFNLEISGSKGYVNVSSLSKWGNQIVSFGLRKYPSGFPKIKSWEYKKDDSWRRETIYVINSILNNKDNIKKINLEGKQTLEVVNKLKNLNV
tara:strand:+ start:2314 stop:3267 length:954 start_codon:yes stop_codon:yes gene_type:complete